MGPTFFRTERLDKWKQGLPKVKVIIKNRGLRTWSPKNISNIIFINIYGNANQILRNFRVMSILKFYFMVHNFKIQI